MILQTTRLSKWYGRTAALSAVDLAVEAGSVYGLVGPNGAGKTTLLAILAGLRRPSDGSIQLEVPRQRVAVLPDTPQFDPWLTGREVVALAARLTRTDAGSGADAGSGIASGTGVAARSGVAASRVDQVLREAGLGEAVERRVGGYSRGMLQRLGIAATVVGEPELLLLDEPASALDPAGRREVLDLIAQLRGRATVVLSSHILADVQEVCDTVGILRAGKLLFQGPLASLLVGRAVPAYRVCLRSAVEPVVDALRGQPWVSGVEAEAPWLRVTVRSLSEAELSLPKVLAECDAHVVSLAPAEANLEDVFLELTS